MSCKWIGAIFIVAGCGGFGFSVAANYRQEERRLRELIRALQLMQCELQYRLTPLPELCRLAGQASGGIIKEVLMGLAAELEWQTEPDAASCMDAVLKRTQTLSARSRRLLHQWGKTLGRFDLEGQLQVLSPRGARIWQTVSPKAACASPVSSSQTTSGCSCSRSL